MSRGFTKARGAWLEKVRPEAITRAKRHMEQLAAKVRPHRIEAGVFNDGTMAIDYRGNPTGESLAAVSIYHEYGFGVPERSWLRPWFDQNLQRLQLEKTVATQKEMRGDSSAMHTLGSKWQGELRAWLASGAPLKSLEADTLAARAAAGIAGARPLIATRQLLEHVRVRVDGKYVD